MSPNRSCLSLLTIFAAVSTVNCGSFSLHFSLSQSTYIQDRTLCVNLIGKARCSLAEIPMAESNRAISFAFDGPNQTTLQVSISLVKRTTGPFYRRFFSVGSTRFLPIDNGTVNVTLHCQKNFFGPACDLHCISDSRKICDNQGQFSCNEGWTGPDCEKAVSTTPIPTSSVTSSTSSPSTTTVTSAGIQGSSESALDATMFYGIYVGLFLIFISILCVALLLIKMNFTIVNAFESMINQRTGRPDESIVIPHSPIFFTDVGMNKIDFDEKDSGRHSFNSREDKSYTEIYV